MRDSPDDFINVTVWGSSEYVNSLFNKFQIGSVGKYITSVYKLSFKISNFT